MEHAHITEEAFERVLLQATSKNTDNMLGLFGPESMMWTVSREAIVFLCAGQAALLQTAHPFVAAAIDQHSNVKSDPRDRFKRTFTNVFDMVFGTSAQAQAKARQVRQVHNHINGSLSTDTGHYQSGAPYSAHDRKAVQWIHATLTDSALRAFEIFKGDLSPKDKEAYWQESLRFAALFGLDADDMPRTWIAFDAWWHETLQGDLLSVSLQANEIANHLLLGKGELRALPNWYVALTAGFLPANLREAYGLSFGPMDRRRAEAAIARLRRLYPLLPEKLKYAPAYHRAEARIKGKVAPDLITRGLEKLWLGL